MQVSFGPALLGLTCVACCIGWLASVELALRMRARQGWRRLVWLAACSAPLGTVLWWLHLLLLSDATSIERIGWSAGTVALSLLMSLAAAMFCFVSGWQDRRGLALLAVAVSGFYSIAYVDVGGLIGARSAGLQLSSVCLALAAAFATAVLGCRVIALGRHPGLRGLLILFLGVTTTAMLAASVHAPVLAFDPERHGGMRPIWIALGGGVCAIGAVALGLLVAMFDRRLEQLTERSIRLLRRNEERLQRVLQQLPFGIIVADVVTDDVLFSNREADRVLLGLQREQRPRAFFPTNRSLGDPLLRALRDEETVDRELQTFRRADGKELTLEISAAPIYDERERKILAIAAFQDVSARVGAEADLRQAQKMEAIGQLTGGIAHDTNNLLTAILGNLDLLEARLTDDHQRALLRNALSATERGAKLTSQLLGFSRRQALTPCPVDVNRAVGDMHPLLTSTLGGTIRIDCALSADVWPAYADPTQLELVLLNLSINARDAMPSGGAITISTANVTLSQRTSPTDPAPGDYVVLSVRDTGTGIAPDTLARVFEPFFTTKGPKGSGLGLPQVLGIAQQLGGGVRIDSDLGRGTTVHLFMARSQSAVEALPSAVVNGDQSEMLDGKTILLVDDDDDVRTAARALLAQFGCIVIEQQDGRSAVARVAGAERIDLVLIDFAMPGMTGADAGEQMRAFRPNLPILVITGHAEADHLPGVEGRFPTLQKPFRGAQLAELLAAMLSQPAHAIPIEHHSIVSFQRVRRGREQTIEPFSHCDIR